MSRLFMVLPAAMFTLALAACDGSGTSISINAKDEGGNSSFKLSLPKIHMNAEDFEVDGVKLYPGSSIDDFRVDATDRGGNNKDDGKVSIAFHSPAKPETVRDWFRDNMTKQGFKVQTNGTTLSGTTDDGDPFSVTLDADGADKAKGHMEVGK